LFHDEPLPLPEHGKKSVDPVVSWYDAGMELRWARPCRLFDFSRAELTASDGRPMKYFRTILYGLRFEV
jgi:hypothetical protein